MTNTFPSRQNCALACSRSSMIDSSNSFHALDHSGIKCSCSFLAGQGHSLRTVRKLGSSRFLGIEYHVTQAHLNAKAGPARTTCLAVDDHNLSCRGRSHSSISLNGWVAFSTLRAASSVSTQASWNMCTIAIIHTYRAPLSIRPACKVLQLAARNFQPTQLRLRDVGVTAHPPDGWRLFLHEH
jgi:hypothetical protein